MHNSYPLISIITITYNRGDVLDGCLESVKKQTFQDIEHIIVDNMSNDNTQELVQAYKKEVSYPVVYVREPDSGLYNALNKGIRKASTPWVHFLHSDDQYWDNDVLRKVLPYLNIEKNDLVAGAIYLGNERYNAEFRISRYNTKLQRYEYQHTASFFYKAIFEKYGYYDENYKVISDTLYCIHHYHKIKTEIIDIPIVFMRSTGVSGSDYSPKMQLERLTLEFSYKKKSYIRIVILIISLIKQFFYRLY